MILRKGRCAAGLEINEESIKVVQLDEVRGGLRLTKWGTLPTPEGSFEKGKIIKTEEIAKTIKRLFALKKIEAKRVVASLPASSILMRLVSLVPMPREEMREFLKGEMEEYAQLAGEEAILDFQVLERLAEEGRRKISVLSLALSRGIVTSYLQALGAAGLEPRALDAASLGVLRALAKSNLKVDPSERPPKTILSLFIDARMATVHILKRGVLRFTYTLDTVPSKEGGLEELIGELKRILYFYQTEFSRAEDVAKVVISPASSDLKELDKRLAEELNVPLVEMADPLKGLEFDKEDRELLAQASSLTVALGLARRGLERGGLQINLLPPEKIKRAQIREKVSFFLPSILSALGMTLLLFLFLQWQIIGIDRKIAKLEEESGARPAQFLEEIREKESEREKVLKEYKEKKDLLKEIRYPPWSEMLIEIQGIIPSGVWLEGMSSQRESLILKGVSLSQEGVFEFITNLNNSQNFSQARLNISQGRKLGAQEVVGFEITCSLERKEVSLE